MLTSHSLHDRASAPILSHTSLYPSLLGICHAPHAPCTLGILYQNSLIWTMTYASLLWRRPYNKNSMKNLIKVKTEDTDYCFKRKNWSLESRLPLISYLPNSFSRNWQLSILVNNSSGYSFSHPSNTPGVGSSAKALRKALPKADSCR